MLKNFTAWQTALILIVGVVNIYSIVQNIRYESIRGTVLAFVSFGALILCANLVAALNKLDREDLPADEQ